MDTVRIEVPSFCKYCLHKKLEVWDFHQQSHLHPPSLYRELFQFKRMPFVLPQIWLRPCFHLWSLPPYQWQHKQVTTSESSAVSSPWAFSWPTVKGQQFLITLFFHMKMEKCTFLKKHRKIAKLPWHHNLDLCIHHGHGCCYSFHCPFLCCCFFSKLEKAFVFCFCWQDPMNCDDSKRSLLHLEASKYLLRHLLLVLSSSRPFQALKKNIRNKQN